MLVVYCYATNLLQTQCPKTETCIFYLSIFVGQEFGSDLAGGSSLKSPMRLIRCWFGLQSSYGLTGAGGSTFRVTLSYDWQVGVGCSQEASVFVHEPFRRTGCVSSQHSGWLSPVLTIQEPKEMKQVLSPQMTHHTQSLSQYLLIT